MGDGIRARHRTETTPVWAVYTVVNGTRGSDTGERVESDTMDYPVNGRLGDYWYVLLRGYTTVYVWDIYNLKTSYGYKEVAVTSGNLPMSIAVNTAPYAGSSYSFDKNTGLFTITNANLVTSQSGLANKWWIDTDFGSTSNPSTTKTASHRRIRYGCSSWDWNGVGNKGTIVATKGFSSERDTAYPMYSKGTATEKIIKSAASDFYPQDGKYGDSWLVYSHSYTGYIDLT